MFSLMYFMNAMQNSELKNTLNSFSELIDEVKWYYLLNTEDIILFYWIGRI